MLIDTILYYASQTQEKLLFKGLSLAVRFQVDNVARYLHEETKMDKHYNIGEKIPNMAPLAPVMWFEYGGLSVDRAANNQYGCLLTIDYGKKEEIFCAKYQNLDLPSEVCWILRAEYFFSNSTGICNSDWIYYHAIKEDGTFFNVYAGENQRKTHVTGEKWVPDESTRKKIHEEVAVALLSLCFSHCKGTVISEHQPTRQVRRAAERTGTPLFTFHTIDIQPSTTVLQTEGHISENGLSRALHICRGHFAHYTAERPLFGKYTGTFYRPMHVRGSTEQGITVKDYRI